MISEVIQSEVRKALRLHPRWAHLRDDLMQDAYEAVLRYGCGDNLAHARISARGAISRCAMYYLGVNEKTGATPAFVMEKDIETMPSPDAQIREYEVAQYLHVVGTAVAAEHGDRDAKVWALHVEGEGGAAIGRELGISRERVRQILQPIYETARRAA